MAWQALLTALLVSACAAYALWSLAPKSLQGRLAAWAGKPLPAAGGACGACDGCGGAPAKPTKGPREQVIHIVRMPPRD